MENLLKNFWLGVLLLLLAAPALAKHDLWDGYIKQVFRSSKGLVLTAKKLEPKSLNFAGIVQIPSYIYITTLKGSVSASGQLIFDNQVSCNYSSRWGQHIYKLTSCSNSARAGESINVRQKIELKLISSSNDSIVFTAKIRVIKTEEVQYGLYIPYVEATEGQILMFNGEAWVATDPGELDLQGLQGEEGPMGPQGEPGVAGSMGPAGATGAAGPKGDKGDKGDAGVAGVAGTKGDKGDTGLTGAQGPKGSTGEIGFPGPMGLVGAKGDAGAIGLTGPQGAKGDTGAMGPIGPQGAKGDAGAIGLTGPQGAKGDTGAMGPMGPQGAKGDAGAIGLTGSQGAKGDQGSTGSIGPQGTAGADGAAGPKGDTGSVGPIGPQGLAGAMGPAGAAGALGPKGDKGDKGDAGVAGVAGAVGAQGPKGDQGEAGLAGPMGLAGAQGADGAAGPKGDKGDKGDSGLSKIAYIRDEKAVGVTGGTCFGTIWNQRVLNTLGGDSSFATLSNNRFTLAPGKYFVEILTPFSQVGLGQNKLRVVETNTDVLYGSTGYSGTASVAGLGTSIAQGELIVTQTSTFEVMQRCQIEKSVSGLGMPNSFGTKEIYTQVKITKTE